MTVRWLVPGESLLINYQVFPIAGCHIVLERKSKHYANEDDQVPTVELWFDKPIEGSLAYEITVDSIGAVKMQRVTQLEQLTDRSRCKWLVCVDGEDGRMLRRLIRVHAKQATKQFLRVDDTPTPTSSTVISSNHRMQTKPIRRSLNSLLDEFPNYWDYIDIDHPDYK